MEELSPRALSARSRKELFILKTGNDPGCRVANGAQRLRWGLGNQAEVALDLVTFELGLAWGGPVFLSSRAFSALLGLLLAGAPLPAAGSAVHATCLRQRVHSRSVAVGHQGRDGKKLHLWDSPSHLR